MDQVQLRDGRQVRGLIREETAQHLAVIQCVQQPDKPLFFIVRSLPAQDIAKVARLEPAQRGDLERKIVAYKTRQQREAGRQEGLKIEPTAELGPRGYRYSGPWFSLLTTGSSSSARLAVARIELRFAAFQMAWPARRTASRPLKIVLWGAREEYQAYRLQQHIDVANGAYFDPATNTIVASLELDPLLDEQAAATAVHRQQLTDLHKQEQELRTELLAEERQLKLLGVQRSERLSNGQKRMQHFKQLRTDLERKLTELERRNQQRLCEYLDESFRTMYHEAFHAYLENYVYPSSETEVPRWLQEGLAQVFESARLELGDRLRTDITVLGQRLAQDLAGQPPLSLAQVLGTSDATYLGLHGAPAREAARHYLYAWALAEFWLQRRPQSRDPWREAEQLDRYVQADREAGPEQRFAELLGRPLPELEAEWQAFLRRASEARAKTEDR